jgi:hypothetical protein
MAHRFDHRLAALPLLLLALASFPSAVSAQAVNENLWVTNANVSGVVRSGNKIYLAGNFTQVGPSTGGGAALDVTTGLLPSTFPRVAGTVYAVASDGAGGWFIGGAFTSVGKQSRLNLARIASDMSVTPWNPQADQPVLCMVVSGSSVIVGGQFTSVAGHGRNMIAAIDAVSGAPTSWNPNAGGAVRAMAVKGSTLYVGGDFGSIGGANRNFLAQLDLNTGSATAWNPDGPLGIEAIAVGPAVVYLGGSFTVAGGVTRNHIAAMDSTSGAATSWNPNANNDVEALAVNGSTVYAGGLFTNIGSSTRNRIAALSITSGLATAWNPNATSEVSALMVSGSKVYAGGTFSFIGGATRYSLASLDNTTGSADSWDPHGDEHAIHSLALSGSRIYAGGEFVTFNAVWRSRLACLDASTGAATAWNPFADQSVDAIAVSGDSIYVGGQFTVVGGQSRNKIARIDSTGAAASWNPGANGEVFCLTLGPGRVYAAGVFTTIGGASRNHVAALDPVSGNPWPWDPNANTDVWTIKVDGDNVYVGGPFTTIHGFVRNHLAQISASGSGSPSAWAPNIQGGYVQAIAVSGSTVFVGGGFANINGVTRNSLAAIDGSGNATSWDPEPNGGISALAVDGARLYVGGGFNAVAAGPRTDLAAYDIPTGNITSWYPIPNNTIQSLSVSGSWVYAGGVFNLMQGDARANLAALQASPELSAVQPGSGGNNGVVTLTITGRNLTSGAKVSLLQPVGPGVIGAGTATVAADGSSLSAPIDLTGAATGVWNVQVTNPDSQKVALPSAFTITSLQAPDLQLALLGPEPIRASYPTSFDLVIENPGNVDALAVPVYLWGIPVSATFGLDFTVSAVPRAGTEPDWSGSPYTFGDANGQVIAFVIPRVPPGSTVRRFTLNVPSSTPQFNLGAAITPTWTGNPPLLGCLSSMGLVSNTSCDATYLGSINSYLAANPQLDAVGSLGIWAKGMWECEGATTLAQADGKGSLILGSLDSYLEQGTSPSGCEDAFLSTWRQVRTIHVVSSIDPNDKLGPVGTVSSTEAIPYSIRFENLSTATAPARQVTVADQLPASLDLSTLSLSSIDLFGTVHLVPPPGSSQFSHDVDLGHDNLIVRIMTALDTPTRQLTWNFTTLDKTTLQPPSNPLLGFLPPNVTPPQGEGSVLFTIKALAATQNGSVIQNSAVLNFDGAAQTTPTVANTLDNTAPSSNVLSLNTPISTSSFPVSWTTTGSPSDFRDYTIYVSEDGNPYSAWKLNTTTTSDTYVPRPGGHNYYFYSEARDQSGNIEAPPTSPDAQTLSTTAVEEGIPRALALLGARPNPARGNVRVAFALPSGAPATLELIDIAGRRVAQRDVGRLGPGHHELVFDGSLRLKAGLYFVRLSQAGQVLNARVVLMR